jgi:hypothetical protein
MSVAACMAAQREMIQRRGAYWLRRRRTLATIYEADEKHADRYG